MNNYRKLKDLKNGLTYSVKQNNKFIPIEERVQCSGYDELKALGFKHGLDFNGASAFAKSVMFDRMKKERANGHKN